MKLKVTIALLISVFFTVNAQEITSTSFGKGLLNFTAKDSSFSVKFAPRIQVRSESSWNHDGTQYQSPEHSFLVRRARLKFNGFAYSPKLKYKIELGLSNRDVSGGNEYNRNTPNIILDAVIKWNFAENFELWAGQTKLPGNVDRVVSSANLQLIDRSLLNSLFNIDRDLGIQLRHQSEVGNQFLMREKVAISQGEGRNVSEGNQGGLQYTGRLEFLPFGEFTAKGDYIQSDLQREGHPKLMVGFTYNFNENAVRERNGLGDYMLKSDGSLYETNITTIFADAMFKYQGFSFMAEYANREAEDPIAIDVDGVTPTGAMVLTGNAVNLQAGYLFKNMYEIAGRFTKLSLISTGNLTRKQYTLGASKYIVGHKLKVQSDLSYSTMDGSSDSIDLRVGFDVHF